MTNEIELLGDDRLWEIFCLEVRGWATGKSLDEYQDPISDFNTFLPYLEKRGWRGTSNRVGSTSAATISVLAHTESRTGRITPHEITSQSSDHPNDLERAAVMALILATRKEREYDKTKT